MGRKYGGPITSRRQARMRAVLERRREGLEVVIEDIWDGHNASAILRSADAFGAFAVNLLYRTVPVPKVSRMVSGNARRWTVLHEHNSVEGCVSALRERGLRLCVTSVDPGSVPYSEVDWSVPSAVAFGNETRGCSAELAAQADVLVHIPMAGFVESLNVSTAAAVLLSEAARAGTATASRAGSWSAAKQALLDGWVRRETERPEAPEGRRTVPAGIGHEQGVRRPRLSGQPRKKRALDQDLLGSEDDLPSL